MSLRLYFGVNSLLLYFTNLADCCHCGVHFHRADTVHAVKKHSAVFTVNWIFLSVCLSALCSAVRTPEQEEKMDSILKICELKVRHFVSRHNYKIIQELSENDVYAGTCSQFVVQTNAHRTAVLTQICTDC